jgi:hypothetical protein
MDTRIVSTRVSTHRYEELQRQAQAAGKTVAELVREILDPQQGHSLSGYITFEQNNGRSFVRVEVISDHGEREAWQRSYISEDDSKAKLDELKGAARKWVGFKFGLEHSQALSFHVKEPSN